ncbi:MAG: hypothetical protein QOI02_1280 [Actinomycetota bacterium]|jgi:hypothetical protein|nr:hypothetical protein [Actinomycetota bacterium]
MACMRCRFVTVALRVVVGVPVCVAQVGLHIGMSCVSLREWRSLSDAPLFTPGKPAA